jgi:hypothetical protein
VSHGIELKEWGRVWDQTSDNDGQIGGERWVADLTMRTVITQQRSPCDLPGAVQDVVDDHGDIDRAVIITAARDDGSKEDPSNEPHDWSDDDAPLLPISKQHVLFVLTLLSEGFNLGELTDF